MDYAQTFFRRITSANAKGRHPSRMSLRQLALAAATTVLGSLASPASAAEEPRAKLVNCGAESCLRIAGTRESLSSVVAINGHVVPAEGRRSWKIDLPIEMVREWSAPHARTMEVSLHDPATQRATKAEVDLPIGLLGGVTDLAMLLVSSG